MRSVAACGVRIEERRAMVFGKVIAGLIGLLTGGIPGLVIGLLVGHAFDRGLARSMGLGSPEQLARIRENFAETLFLLSGYLAKADGRVSEAEIAHTEALFAQMGLDPAGRRAAIESFRRGAAPAFQAQPVVDRFTETCRGNRQLKRTLLIFLVSLAHADQALEPAEHDALARIAGWMGLGAAELETLLRMARAQERFHDAGAGPSTARPGGDLEDAYAALGVDSAVSDRDLKRAYRKLMSENHPDKLIARGVPEDMLKLATERAQEIQSAYELIRRHRRPGR